MGEKCVGFSRHSHNVVCAIHFIMQTLNISSIHPITVDSIVLWLLASNFVNVFATRFRFSHAQRWANESKGEEKREEIHFSRRRGKKKWRIKRCLLSVHNKKRNLAKIFIVSFAFRLLSSGVKLLIFVDTHAKSVTKIKRCLGPSRASTANIISVYFLSSFDCHQTLSIASYAMKQSEHFQKQCTFDNVKIDLMFCAVDWITSHEMRFALSVLFRQHSTNRYSSALEHVVFGQSTCNAVFFKVKRNYQFAFVCVRASVYQ